jgi:nucleoside-diphosphate-sugar epimerase
MRIAVTGATGFVGTRLVERLVAGEHHVLVLTRRMVAAFDHPLISAEIVRLDSVGPAMLDGADAVVHCAVTESQEPAEARHVNRDGTQAIAQASLQAGVPRFVHISSAAIYDFAELGDIQIEETHPLVPHGNGFIPSGGYPSVYAVTKAEAEDELSHLSKAGLPVTILRPTGVLGAGANSAWGTRVPHLFLAGNTFPRHPENTFGFIGVEDLVDAIVAAISTSATTTANVVGGHVPFSAYIDALEKFLPGRPRLERATELPAWRGSYSIQTLRQTLGVEPEQTFEALMDEIGDYWSRHFPESRATS